MSAPIKAALKGEVAFRTETMRRRLNSRCKGLLEAPTVEKLGPEAKVQYLHRTVRIQGALFFLFNSVSRRVPLKMLL